MNGKFCGSCGAAAGGGAAPPPPHPPSAQPTYDTPTQEGLADHEAGALCYLPAAGFIISILFLVLAPYNKNPKVRFHAFQGLFLACALFFLMLAVSMLTIIPFIGGLLSLMFWVASICGMLYVAYQTYQKQPMVLPLIGPIAEQQSRQM